MEGVPGTGALHSIGRLQQALKQGRKGAKQFLPQFYVLVCVGEVSYVCDTHTHTHNNTTVGRIGVVIPMGKNVT